MFQQRDDLSVYCRHSELLIQFLQEFANAFLSLVSSRSPATGLLLPRFATVRSCFGFGRFVLLSVNSIGVVMLLSLLLTI